MFLIKKIKIFFVIGIFVFLPFTTKAISLEEERSFFIESSYDYEKRKNIETELVLITNYIYFYVDSSWWSGIGEKEKEKYEKNIYELGNEFEKFIYPKITNLFGTPPKKEGASKDDRFFVVFHPMKSRSGGYFRSGDQYSIYQYSYSNEENLLYLNTSLLSENNLAGYLAHEYMHLVTFNEKNKKYGVNEEIWLNEMRAEIVSTILGYDSVYKNSNLETRVDIFLRDPDISLTEWTEQVADYGVINLFGQYLLDHYGEKIFSDSLKTNFVGISSINYALKKNKYKKNFAEIFNDWMVAVFLNDCSYGDNYCYKNENLKKLKITPTNINVSYGEENIKRTDYQTKNWAGNWYKITGDEGELHLTFNAEGKMVVSYILCDFQKKCVVEKIKLDNSGRGAITIKNFNTKYSFLAITPVLQQRLSGFDDNPEKTVSFWFEAEIKNKEKEEEILEKENIKIEIEKKLLLIKEELEKIYLILGKEVPSILVTKKFEKDLSFGMSNSVEVMRLQNFLKKEGEDIYKEGLVTGNFYHLTKQAVINFQEKYKEEILLPIGLFNGTGYVGEYTRNFINSLIEKNK